MHDRKIKEVEKRAEINARLLQEELTRQKQQKQLKSSSVPKFIKKKAKEPTVEPPLEEEEDSIRSLSLQVSTTENIVEKQLKANYKGKLAKSKRKISTADKEIKEPQSPKVSLISFVCVCLFI